MFIFYLVGNFRHLRNMFNTGTEYITLKEVKQFFIYYFVSFVCMPGYMYECMHVYERET